MRVAIASDQGGYDLKCELLRRLQDLQIEFVDFGSHSDASVDYPDYAIPVAEAVAAGEFERGILLCGTGLGMCITANKVQGIRAVTVHDVFSAEVTRAHNDSNVLTMGGRVVSVELAETIARLWLTTAFEGGRHLRRIEKISAMEREEATVQEIEQRCHQAAAELIKVAGLTDRHLLVIGASSSEIAGKRIGTAGSNEIASAVLDGLWAATNASGVQLAFQCCEHLNRALVVERATMESFHLDEVAAIPVLQAGGAISSSAFRRMHDPVLVERLTAHAGIDIGDTFIGMHLRRVAVPVRLEIRQIGQAHVTAARTRPPLIGGERAVYDRAAPECV